MPTKSGFAAAAGLVAGKEGFFSGIEFDLVLRVHLFHALARLSVEEHRPSVADVAARRGLPQAPFIPGGEFLKAAQDIRVFDVGREAFGERVSCEDHFRVDELRLVSLITRQREYAGKGSAVPVVFFLFEFQMDASAFEQLTDVPRRLGGAGFRFAGFVWWGLLGCVDAGDADCSAIGEDDCVAICYFNYGECLLDRGKRGADFAECESGLFLSLEGDYVFGAFNIMIGFSDSGRESYFVILTGTQDERYGEKRDSKKDLAYHSFRKICIKSIMECSGFFLAVQENLHVSYGLVY